MFKPQTLHEKLVLIKYIIPMLLPKDNFEKELLEKECIKGEPMHSLLENLCCCKNLLGIYIQDTNKPEWENKIILCYKGCGQKSIQRLFNSSKYAWKKYLECINNIFYEIFSFEIPNKFKRDINALFTHCNISEELKTLMWYSPLNTDIDIIDERINNLNLNYNKKYRPKLENCILNLNEINIKKEDISLPF